MMADLYPFSITYASGKANQWLCGTKKIYGANKDDARRRFLSENPNIGREHLITLQPMKHAKPASCRQCGETWKRDPRLEVACPECRAPIGRKCKRPSGHECDFHIPREQAAVDAGFLTQTCPAVKRAVGVPPTIRCNHPETAGKCTSSQFCNSMGKCRFSSKSVVQTSAPKPRFTKIKRPQSVWDAL